MKITFVALFYVFSFLLCIHAADKKIWAKSILGQKGPDLVVEKWLTDEPNTKDKFVLIDLWATWCGPCLKAIPELNKFHKEYGDKLIVIGISDETEEKVKKFESPKIKYYSAIDSSRRTKKELKVTGIPHVIIMDPNGIVRWEGFPLLSEHELTDAVLEEVFKEYSDSKAKKGS